MLEELKALEKHWRKLASNCQARAKREVKGSPEYCSWDAEGSTYRDCAVTLGRIIRMHEEGK